MSKTPKAIEFKASTLAAMTAIVHEADPDRLGAAMHAMFGDSDECFAGEITIVDLGQITNTTQDFDFKSLFSVLRRYGLQPVALKGLSDSLDDSARTAGFAVLTKPAARAPADIAAAPTVPTEKTAPTVESLNAKPIAMPTKVIDRPVRSGQQIYARDGDLILLNGVSPGAEVIADGSIHCYGPLRGRAVAGAKGSTAARVFCSNFGPELISIAGVYRTFERGIDKNLAAKPAQAFLRAEADSGGEKHVLNIESLKLD